MVVLFGGDHGDQNCPISCKINLASPLVRKEKQLLGYQCPVVTFASVECSTDAFELMNKTIMPRVKQQLIELDNSSMVTVYHRTNFTKAFRSYMVPSTISTSTIAFKRVEGEGEYTNLGSILMTYSFGNNQQQPSFGSIRVDDPVFAEVVISFLKQLFIGDLAFLAMLVGMNHSAGAHCLLCTSKASEFNCTIEKTTASTRSKTVLVDCLQKYEEMV